MKTIRVFLKNINVLNLLLLATAIFLFFELNYSLINKKIKVTIPKPKEIVVKTGEKASAEIPPAYLDYVSVTEKNIFHPERKMPSEKKEEQMLAKPEIILYGTLITSEKRVAYIEDKKSPYSTPGRGKRQVCVNEGSMIAGYKVVAVNAESILLVHGDDKIVVTLRVQKERKPGETTGNVTLSNPAPNFRPGADTPTIASQVIPIRRTLFDNLLFKVI